MQKFMLGAYWDARPAEVSECAEKATRFFRRLSEIDPLLAHWYERSRSRKEALRRKIDCLDVEKVQELFLKGRNRTDVRREVIDELGFKLGLWNGAENGLEASLAVHCGCYNDRVGNNVIIDLPHSSESPAWVDNAVSLLALVAEIWQPEWAGIMSKQAMRDRDFDGDRPFADWLVYVPRAIPSVPSPARFEVLNNLGSIIVLHPHPPTGDELDRQPYIREVESILSA